MGEAGRQWGWEGMPTALKESKAKKKKKKENIKQMCATREDKVGWQVHNYHIILFSAS